MKRIFGKRDKSSPNLSAPGDSLGRFPATFSNKSSEYVLPDLSTPPDCNGSEAIQRTTSPTPSSHSRRPYANLSAVNSKISFTMSGFKRKQTLPSQDAATPRGSMASSRSTETEVLPSRTSVFTAFAKSASSHSLPTEKAHDNPPQLPPILLGEPRISRRPPAMTAQTLPVPKTPEMRTSNTVKIFNWGSKPTRMSDTPQLDLRIPSGSTQDTPDSFSLKSFRPVRPLSPQPPAGALDLELNTLTPPPVLEQTLSESSSTFAPPSPIGGRTRSRVGSTASDASQKITVAQFRQAQIESAKNRSSVHLPVPEHPSDSMPPGNVPLHVSLARPNSPGFAMNNSFVNTETGGGNAYENEDVGGGSTPNGTPSRPARLLPPQAMGRSSPIPRNGSPIASPSSPRLRPQPSQQPPEGSRLSAKWMVSSSSDSDSSDNTASDDFSRRKAGRPARKPPLIGDLRMKGGSNSPQPQPAQRSNGPYPSSFASSSSLKATILASKSDLGHSSGSTAQPHNDANASPPRQVPQSRNGSITLSSSPSQNIKPGQYSGGQERSSSVLTHKTSQSVDVWSNTHSQVHSRQNSRDQIQVPKGITKSDLGHGSPITRSNAPQRTNKHDSPGTSSSNLSKADGVSRSLSTNVLGSTTSSFTRANPRTVGPVESEADDEEQASSEEEEDDAPLSSLVPPRRIGSGYSQGSASPSGSARNHLSDQSPSTSPRPDSALASLNVQTGSPNFSRPSGAGPSRQGSSHSTTSGTVTSDPRSRGRRPLLDFSPTSPKSLKSIPSPIMSSPMELTPNGGQVALLTPPISEKELNGTGRPRSDARNATSKGTVGFSGREMASAGSPAFLRAGSAPINRSHDFLSRPLIRDDSPVSSIGNSSVGSGRYPQTPRSGSDAGLNVAVGSNSTITTSSGSSVKNSNGKRNSVTFDDTVSFAPEKVSHRRSGNGVSERSVGHNRATSLDDEEALRNERRRSEAKNAVELGRVVNGPPPVDSDDETHERISARSHSPTHQWNAWQQMQMQQMQAMSMGMPLTTPTGMPSFHMGSPAFNPMMSMNMGNMSNMMPSPQMFNPMMSNGFGMPPGFSLPPVPPMPNMMMGMDPAVMAAHQQAMLMAKQAYQMAVAQQAIAAAGEEWERSSNMGGYSGTSSRPPTLFGAPTGAMYGGGSLLGVPGMGSGSVWGGSVFGEPFGPSLQQQSGGNNHAFPSSATEFGENTRGPRKRTLTAPSSALPPAHLRGAGAPPLPPPSSWRPS